MTNRDVAWAWSVERKARTRSMWTDGFTICHVGLAKRYADRVVVPGG